MGDRLVLFQGSNWIFLFAGSLTAFFCGWLAVTEKELLPRTAYLVGGSSGFVIIALGLSDWRAAISQLLGLVLGGVLLFLVIDLIQIEYAPAPPDPRNAARTIPVKRPLRFRLLLVFCYIVGLFCQLALPFSPAYLGRWETFQEMLSGGHRLNFALALTGLALMALGAAQSLALFLPEPRHTLESLKGGARLPLLIPLLLALITLGLGSAPSLLPKGINELYPRLGKAGDEGLSGLLAGPASLGALLLLGSIPAILLTGWRTGRSKPAPAFNGGMLFGLEAEAEHKALLSHSLALAVVEEETESFGFEDEFFRVGLKHNLVPPSPKINPRLSGAEYFGPLVASLGLAGKLLDLNYSGSLFSRGLFKFLNWIRRVLEWLTERFYPALAAFLVLIFIFLLTR